MAVFTQGFAPGLSLIVAIGAQNAVVLRQGLRREHVGSVVAFCAVADAVLIAVGVLGMALGPAGAGLARGLAVAGAVCLAGVRCWRALRRAWQPQRALSVDAAATGQVFADLLPVQLRIAHRRGIEAVEFGLRQRVIAQFRIRDRRDRISPRGGARFYRGAQRGQRCRPGPG
jgi:hypothetical protein